MRSYPYIAILSETFFHGLGIISIEHGIDAKVVFQPFSDAKVLRKRSAVIRYAASGQPYFVHAKTRYYLSEFLTIGGN